MEDMTAFERQLAAELGRMAGPGRRIDALAMVRTVSTPPMKWRFQPMFGATKLVVAAVIVALFGGFLLAGVLTTQPEETIPAVGATTTPESTTQPIELPAEIPEGIESGTLETPVGPARWVRLTGDETTIPPDLFGLISTPDGYVVPTGSGPYSGGGTAELWRSPDLIGWISQPLDIEARDGGELSWSGDAYWLGVHEPASLWRSPDTKSWEQVSLERLVPPGPEGFAWTLEPGRPLTHGGVTIVPFEWRTDSWVVVRGLPGADQLEAANLIEIESGVFDIDETKLGTDNRRTFITVRFEETSDGLRVIDHEDGTELTVLKGVSMEFIKLLARRFDGDDFVGVESEFDDIAWQPQPRLAILDGAELVEVEPPLEGAPYRQAYTVDQGGFLSVTVGPDGLVHVHRSQDGHEWSETDVIGDDADEPTDITTVWTHGGAVSLGTSEGEWTSTDGLTWEPWPPVSLWTDPGFYPIATGWILWPFDTNPVTGVQDVGPGNIIPRIWFQPREGEPVPIDIREMALPMSDCGGGISLLSPNTIASHFDEDCGVRDLLIITFDDVPA